MNIIPVLQYRWKLEEKNGKSILVYYGLRNYPKQGESIINISEITMEIIKNFDGKKNLSEYTTEINEELEKLLREKIIVDKNNLKKESTPENKQTCVKCVNNDYVIAGLEFDENGLCAFCQCYENRKITVKYKPNIIDENQILEVAKTNKESRFDVMVLYTGGKDSTFLLWYLGKKLKLRVLAATWNMPYMNEICRDNMHNAMKNIPTAEFVERSVSPQLMKSSMQGQFHTIGMPCLCPFVAYGLFYPQAFYERIPIIMSGLEEVQVAVIDYVCTPPAGAAQKQMTGREHTLQIIKSLITPTEIKKAHNWGTEFVNYKASVYKEMTQLFEPMKRIYIEASQNSSIDIPLIKNLSTNTSYGRWEDVISIIKNEMGWQMPQNQENMLHTSCQIERIKDYTQFMRFKNMRTNFFPQSIVEISAAVYFGLITREEAIKQLNDLGYWKEPAILQKLLKDLDITAEEIDSGNDELHYALR